MKMEFIPASEANLCPTCIDFADAVSRRSRVFHFDTSSETSSECESNASSSSATYSDASSTEISDSSSGTSSKSSLEETRDGMWPTSDGCRLCQVIAEYYRGCNESWPTDVTSLKIFYWNYPIGLPGRVSELGIDPLDMNGHGQTHLRRLFSVWASYDKSNAVSREIANEPALPSDCCPEAFDHLRSWVSSCVDSHTDCRRTIPGAFVDDINGPPLPTRVLDVGDIDDNHVRLTESHGRKGKFCALSYCWGQEGHNIVTKKANYGRHIQNIEWTELPRTFQDAIKITREIGVRFLWIDSLCIVQDDKADWASESGRMSAVYATAHLVIAASGASDPSMGCFSSKPRCSVAVEIPCQLSLGSPGSPKNDDDTVWITPRVPSPEAPSSGPLSKRGWVLQEGYLARRTVFYMPGGMSWGCKSIQHTERSRTDLQLYDDWTLVLLLYSLRNLTFRADRLPALQGLANAFQERSNDRYYIGTFESELPKQLLWRMTDGWVEETANFPSWSWASKEGSKMFLTIMLREDVRSSNRRIRFDEESGALHIQGLIALAKVGGVVQQKDTHDVALRIVASILYARKSRSLQRIQNHHNSSEIIGVAAMDGSYVGTVTIAFLSGSSWDDVKRWYSEESRRECLLSAPNDADPSLSAHLHLVLILAPTGQHGHYWRIGVGAILRDPDHSSVQANEVEYVLD